MVGVSSVTRIIKWVAVAFVSSTVLAVVALRFLPVVATPLMFIRMVEQVADGRIPRLHHRWVSIDRMSPDMPRAAMAGEDARFLQHHGFDFKAIESAAKHNQKATTKHGASTISQQTAKNVFLWPGRTWVRKGLEAYFTVLIELFWSKERIMEVYLNSIEMGDGIYGLDAVAEWHFGTTAAGLTRRQCATIAATFPNPRRYNSAQPDSYVRKHTEKILRNMRFVETWSKEKAY